MVYRQDEICVSCGRYMGKSEDMICKYCKEENSPKKRLDKRKGLWYNIVKILKALRKK